MYKALLREARQRPFASITTASGIILICLGLIVGNSTSTSKFVEFLADIIVVIGTILSTIASAFSFGEVAASKSIIARLDILLRQISTCSAHISQSIHDAQNSGDPEIAIARIDQAINTLSVVSADMEKLTGGEIKASNEEILASRREIEALGRRFTSLIDDIDQAIDDPTTVQQELEEMRETIGGLLDPQNTSVSCPRCGTSVSVRLRLSSGSSGSASCDECGASFMSHRDAQLKAFAGSIRGYPRTDAQFSSTHNAEIRFSPGTLKMALPVAEDRTAILLAIHDAWTSGRLKTPHDLRAIIEESATDGHRSVLRVPLAFALNKGSPDSPLRLSNEPDDASKAFHDRPVERPDPNISKDDWVMTAHCHWISQAIFRMIRRYGKFSLESVVNQFFQSPTNEEKAIVTKAMKIAEDRLRQAPPPISRQP